MAPKLVRKPDPEPDPEASVVRPILEEIDREQEHQRAVDAAASAPVGNPISFKGRRAVTSAKPMPVDGEDHGDLSGLPEDPQTQYVLDRIESSRPQSFSDWSRQIRDKYLDLLSVRAGDFIDHNRLNAVMADYPAILTECIREARMLKNAAENARRTYTRWWSKKLIEAQNHANEQDPPKKLTSQTAVESYAQGLYADEIDDAEADVILAERKSDFIGSIKDMIRNMPTVLKALAGSIQFEWSTSGGITLVEGEQNFRLTPAPGQSRQPDPEALTRVLKHRNLDNTENR